MFQTTRRQLALWYTLVTAILLLLFATGFYLYVRETLIDRIDDTLKHVVEVVERTLQADAEMMADSVQFSQDLALAGPFAFSSQALKAADLTLPIMNTERVEDDRIDLEWFNPQGQLLWSTSSQTQDIPLNLQSKGTTVYLWSGYGLRQLTRAIQMQQQIVGYLRVSHPWFEVTKPIQQLSLDLTMGLILMVLSAAGIGWLLSGIAMKPVWQSYERLKQFTADASHELRSPIASLQTNVQVVLSDPTLDPQMQHNWHIVERLTRRLGSLVEDLLFLARHDSGIKPQSSHQICPLDELLLQVIEEQTAIAQGKQIKISFDIQTTPTSPAAEDVSFNILGDFDQLTRLFTNLVINSIQYTPAGGSVAILLKSTVRQGLLYFQIQVSDTGIGIPQESQYHLFERFYRVDPARSHEGRDQGSGLGLSIAHAIALNHQGTIEVESELGQGSTFTVMLPVSSG